MEIWRYCSPIINYSKGLKLREVFLLTPYTGFMSVILLTRPIFLGLYPMDYTGSGIIRCSSLLKLLKLQGEPLA